MKGLIPSTGGPAKGRGVLETNPAIGASLPDSWVVAVESSNCAPLSLLLKTPVKTPFFTSGSVAFLFFTSFFVFLSSR